MQPIYTVRGAWVWFAIAALNSLACALDLAQRRATPSPYIVIDPPTNNYRDQFKAPLRADLAPLCGNGRLDTLVDYEAYSGWNATVEYRLKVNEVCDDGNRLDGDGCAADCASLDGFTSPCPLALAVDEPLRFVGFLNGSLLVVVTPTRKMYVNAETLKPFSEMKLLDGIADVVSGVLDPTSMLVWLYGVSSANVGAVWSEDGVSFAVDASTIGIWASFDNGELLLITGAGQMIDAKRARLLRVWNATEGAQLIEVSASLLGTTMHLDCRFQDGHWREFKYQPTTWSISDMVLTPSTDTNAAFESNLWASLFLHAVLNRRPRTMRSTTSITPRYIINAESPIRDDFKVLAQVAPWFVGVGLLSPRDAFQPRRNNRFHIVGDPDFNDKLNRREFLVCNGTHAPCVLDVPLCFDPLAPNPYAVNRAQETMYTALVEAAKGASQWSEVPARANLRLGCTPEVARQVLTHPVTGALWIVRGSQVFEVGRRGTQYKLANGQCLPSHSGRACPVGSWASTTSLSCADCAVNASLYNGSLAWKQQCGGATLTVAKGRRLLAEEEAPKQTIQLIYVSTRTDIWSAGDAASLLRRAVNDGVCTCMATAVGGTWRVAYACILTELKSPSDALRALRAIVVPGVQDFVAPPSVGWSRSAETTSDKKDEGPSVGVIVGATAAGVLGVVLIVALFAWVLHRRSTPRRYQPVAATTNHS
jgi:cysteine-rich repeat protein